ncbi:MAG: peptidase domain-containing ABC transporter [Flammeovirgaceae bacterium]
MLFNKRFPHYKQFDMMDCGPTCLRIIARHFGKTYSARFLRELTYKGKQGVNMLSLSDAAEKIGFRTMAVKCSFDMLEKEKPTPFIAHWRQNHFIVVYKIKDGKVYCSDPAATKITYPKEEFCKYWISTKEAGEDEGIALLFEPTPKLYTTELEEQTDDRGVNLKFYAKYLIPHLGLLGQIGLGMLLGTVFTLVAPFMTQALVDQGIENQDINFVYMILAAQIMLFLGQQSVSILRSWILLHMSTRINISVISDFLSKLMKLPLGFFDSKNMGDILQRMGDHGRIQSFLTNQSLEIVFSFYTLVLYSFIMLYYSVEMYIIFVISSIIYVTWVLAFLKKRKELDYRRFNQAASTQNTEVQLIQAMQEIKLHTCEKQKRWEWERIQIRLFKIAMSTLRLEQFQGTGSAFINHLKSILISFWAAKEVIEGNMTLGMMMAATQILGQLDGPIMQFVGFIQQGQDAKISLERLGEVHKEKEEEEGLDETAYILPEKSAIRLEQVSFRYGDPNGEWVLDDITMDIPYGKTTALVGESGSGKTTLLKLLLRFYEPEKGQLSLNDTPLQTLSPREWRKKCGVVMQEGHIFSDTIARNIAIADEVVDKQKLLHAADIANARGFIEELPLNYNTKIGGEGLNLSTGQKQRVMIARAIYKEPEYIFFDEASSSLDAKNEREITQKIQQYNQNRTAVIIAHRLSTVKHADNIIVLEKGKLVEQGTHQQLVALKGRYFELVSNQLELAKD